MSHLPDSYCCGNPVKIDPDGIPTCTECFEPAYKEETEEETE